MVPFRVFALVLAGLLCSASAVAEEALVYQGPVPIAFQGQTVSLPVAVFASADAVQTDRILLHADVNLDDLQPLLLQQLRLAARDRVPSCEVRLTVQDAYIRVNGGQIVLTTTVQGDIWLCTSVVETPIGSDAFTIDIGAIPEIRGGRLQLAPGTLAVRDMNETLRSMGGETLLRNLYAEALSRFNRDPRLTTLPDPLTAAGYSYVDIVPGGGSAGADSVRVSVAGPNDIIALVRTLANMR